MNKETRKQVNANLNKIWKLYSATWNTPKKFKYEDAIVKITGTLSYNGYPYYDSDTTVDDLNVKFKSGTGVINIAEFISTETIHEDIELNPEKYGISADLRSPYEEIGLLWSELPAYLSEYDWQDILSDYGDSKEEFVEYVNGIIEEEEDKEEALKNAAFVKLNGTYTATILPDGRVKVGCQTIPIEAVKQIIEKFDEISKPKKT